MGKRTAEPLKGVGHYFKMTWSIAVEGTDELQALLLEEFPVPCPCPALFYHVMIIS